MGAYSPIRLVVTDAKGDVIKWDFNGMGLGSTYDTTQDINSTDLSGPDGELDDVVTIPSGMAGEYQIRLVKDPGAPDTARFTVAIRAGGQ